MPTDLASPRSAYKRSAVLTASQEQLLVMLYDGAQRFLTQAQAAMSEKQVEVSHNKLRKAELIIAHLRGSLDYEQGGDLAVRLDRIYAFCTRHLNSARVQQDPARVEEVRMLLGTLRQAWSQVAHV
jgi:flagellar protein FliS